MKIFFSSTEDLPGSRDLYFVHYYDVPLAIPDGKQLEIVGIQREIQERVIDQIEHWHSRLCSKASSISRYWWLLDASRLCLHHSDPVFRPLLLVYSVIEICQRKGLREVCLVDFPPVTEKIFQEHGHTCVLGSVKKRRATLHQSISCVKRKMDLLLGRGIAVVRILLAMSVSICSPKKEVQLPGTLIVTTLVSNPCVEDWEDHYFGALFDGLPTASLTDVAWCIVPDRFIGKKEKAALKKKITGEEMSVTFPQELVGPRMIAPLFRSLIAFKKMKRSLKKTIGQEFLFNQTAETFGQYYYDWMIASEWPISQLILYFSLAALLEESPKVRRIIYPYEEKGSERAIQFAIEKSRDNIKSIGFAHSVGWNLNQYVRKREQQSCEPPRPDYYAATGPEEKDWLVDFAGIGGERIYVLGSPRAPTPGRQISFNRPLSEHKLKIFFPVGQGRDLSRLANWVAREPTLLDDCHIHIRPYPYAWCADQERGLRRLKGVDFVTDWKADSSVDSEIHWADIVLFTTTSVGFRSMLMGRYTINLNLQDTFYWDLSQKTDAVASLDIAMTPRELSQAIKKFHESTDEQIRDRCRQMAEFARSIYEVPSKQSLRQILDL